MEHFGAVREERRTTLTQVESPRIELREQRHEMRRGLPFAIGDACDFGE
jgi:hypothetical protein